MKKLLLLISFVFYTMCINAQSVSFGFDSTMFIPDGPNCPPGILYANVLVNNFPTNAVISTDSDIVSICINIEHSFSGDLGFKLFCPNGQSVVLDRNSHSGGNYFGMPFGSSNHGSYDNGCFPMNNPSGFGWNYCWSEFFPNNGFTINQLSADTSGFGTTLIGNIRIIDSTNVYNFANYFKPDSTLTSLIGCPLNGTWSMQITDDFAIDNGYVFHWSIEFPATVPATPIITLIGDTLFSDAPLGNQWYDMATGAIVGATAAKYHPLQTGDYFTMVSLNGQ
ncbi:MAG: proprotein convertase P-domain-containing protein, partial [Bacteroidales bacterium]